MRITLRLFTFCVVALTVAGSVQTQQNQNQPGALTIEQLKSLREQKPDLLDVPGIHGIAIGAGQLVVFIDKDLDSRSLQALRSVLRSRLAPVDWEEKRIGEIRAESFPAAMGSSTSNTAGCFTGTLGVTAKRNGKIGYITCNHVAAAEENRLCPNVGNAKRQVSPATGLQPHCNNGARIGHLDKPFPPIDFSGKTQNHVDAAFVAQRGVGVHPLNRCSIPWTSTIVPAAEGMKVLKCGAATNLTDGKVEYKDMDINVSYRCGLRTKFYNQIVIMGKDFSASGDSGSVAFTEKGEAIGLLFAGAQGLTADEKRTFANPMQAVLDGLGGGAVLCPYPCQ
jgi:hypothetical protein